MPNIYSGKASKVEWNTEDVWSGAQVDLGEMKSAKISFEPEIFEGLANDHPVGGYGLLELELAEATAARRTVLEAKVNATMWLRITSAAGDYYKVYGPVTLSEERDFADPKTPHLYKIRVRRYCDNAGDFCAAPTD